MKSFITYVNYFKAYLATQSKSAHTIKQYGLDSSQFIRFVKENKYDMITEEVIKKYKVLLQDNYTSIPTINRKLASLKSFIKFLQHRNLMKAVDEQLFLPFEKENKELHLLSPKQIKQALEVWNSAYETTNDQEVQWMALRNFLIMRLIAGLGIKPSEVVRMKWSHILDEQVRILTKKHFRDLSISSDMLNMLEIFKQKTLELFPTPFAKDFIWLGLGNKHGEPITVKTIERLFLHVSKTVGFKVTCTNVRYFAIQDDLQTTDDVDLLVDKFGYARKSVLTERISRM